MKFLEIITTTTINVVVVVKTILVILVIMLNYIKCNTSLKEHISGHTWCQLRAT